MFSQNYCKFPKHWITSSSKTKSIECLIFSDSRKTINIGMKNVGCLSLAFYGILVLLFAMISFVHSMPHERDDRFERHEQLEEHNQHQEHPLNIQNAAIFSAPKIAKEICPDGMIWHEGKCRIFID